MARTLTPAHTTANARTIVAPLWFLQIGFTTPLRLTSGPTVTWNSLSWTEANLKVSGIKWDGSIGHSVTFELADPTQAYATLCASQKLTNKVIQLWLTDATALAVGDPILMPPLVGDNWALPRDYTVQMTALVTSNKSLPATQWVALLPPELTMQDGQNIRWNNGEIPITPRLITG